MGSIRKKNAHAEGWFFLNDSGEAAYKKHRQEISMNNEKVQESAVNAAAAEEPKAKPVEAKPVEAKPNGKANGAGKKSELLAPNGKAPTLIEVYPEDVEIPTDKTHPLYDRRAIEELDAKVFQDIMANGIRVPIAVREKPGEKGKYEIVDGRTRLRSARAINRTRGDANQQPFKIQAHLYDVQTPLDAASLKHDFNEMRNERDQLGKAEAMVELIDLGMTQAQVATKFGVVPKTVARAKKVIKEGSEDLHKALRDGKVTLVQAINIAHNYAKEDQGKMVDYVIDRNKKLDSECAASLLGGEPKKAKKKPKALKRDVYMPLVLDMRRNTLNDKVTKFTAEDMKWAIANALAYASGEESARKKLCDDLEAIGWEEPEGYLDPRSKKEEKEAKEPKAKGKKASKKAAKKA
jgi:ParB-like chromosome segregation protein Spo0J